MWQKFPEEFFYTLLTPVETDEIVMSMVKAGAISPNAANEEKETLLHITTWKFMLFPEKADFYFKMARTLIEAGANPNAWHCGITPLALAAEVDNTSLALEMIRLLID